jgi:UDP-3-O-[3-hydroxymyristoyl] glucosamine N-acyltransferase
MRLTIALWPGRSGFAAHPLLGVPLWQRSLDATRGLGADRRLWLRTRPSRDGVPESLAPVSLDDLSRLRENLVVIPAELGCLRGIELKRLLKQDLARPRGLSFPGLTRPVVAARGSHWSRALSTGERTLEGVIRRLAPTLLLPRDEDDLLLVESASSWARAGEVLRNRKIEELQRKGVLVSDPRTLHVDPEVEVGSGTRIHPFVLLEGKTVIGRDVVIGSFSHVVRSTLGAGTIVLDHCFIRESRVGRNVQIGPFAHLRPDSDVGPEAKVGNFVELKNTKLGKGAKAPHLSYLGDALIGKGTNVGAGTITCNYDGVRKHRTVVGDGAFIGSDVQLVAPVKVGNGAYVGAGSCIVEDVPPRALALARSRQIVKPGWAAARARAKAPSPEKTRSPRKKRT